MKKGISFYFGYNIKPKIRAILIKEAGFTSVITTADKKFNKQNGNIKTQVKYFKKNNLELSSLHMQYISNELPNFWKEGKIGEHLKHQLIKDVIIAKKYGFSCVVVHVDGKYSPIGEKRIKEILDFCEKVQIPLAIENTHSQKLFLDIFNKISSPMLKFCYDSGHNNAFDKDFDYSKKYFDKLIALHLHDNNGTADQHTLNKFGNINWKNIASKLKGKDKLSLDYEILSPIENNMKPEDVLKEIKKQADELEKMILKI